MNDDTTPLLTAAIAVHEGFTAYVQAGFTRDEALQLVIAQLGMAWGNRRDDKT